MREAKTRRTSEGEERTGIAWLVVYKITLSGRERKG